MLKSSIHLKVEASDDVGTFVADGQRIRQILFNLLSNAIGFSQPGQTVVLSALRRNEEIILKVSDQGRGIPPEVIDDVFKRFKTDSLGSKHPRRWPRPVDRAFAGRIARRPGRDRNRAQSRHHHGLHIPRPGHTLAKAAGDKAGGIAAAAGGEGCICD